MTNDNSPILAIMYDFDKTLSTQDMQNYTFIPNLELTSEQFWQKTSDFSNTAGVERILSYMYVMISEAKKKGIKLTKEYLNECGKAIKFFPGVTTWFERINKIGEELGVKVEHYLVSSGTKEIVEGCSIQKNFKKIYGCEYYYDEEGQACWPKNTINYTQKTQFYFRIHKGTIDELDDENINKRLEKNRVPYQNIVYIGDGMTDVPAMTLVKQNGGTAIAVYSKSEGEQKSIEIYNQGRVQFFAEADYGAGKKLEKIMKLVIQKVSVNAELNAVEEKLASKIQ